MRNDAGRTPGSTRSSRSARAARPALMRSPLYRVLVPAAVVLVASGTVIVLALAAAVLLGVLPYPGR